MKTWFQRLSVFLSRWVPPVLVMIMIFWWSEQTDLPGAHSPTIEWWDYILKKIAHMIEYGLLFYFLSRAINWGKPLEERSYKLVFFILVMYAFSDEIHQSFTPSRQPKLIDVGFDILGGLIVYLRETRFI